MPDEATQDPIQDSPQNTPEQNPEQEQPVSEVVKEDSEVGLPQQLPEQPVEEELEPSTSKGGGDPMDVGSGEVVESPIPVPEPKTVTITEVMPVFPAPYKPKDLWQNFLNKLSDRKRKKLDKILQVLDGNGPASLGLRGVNKITNDQVEKLLHVSDSTATRYLDQLEKEGKIRQVGKTGKYIHYIKSN